MNEIFNVSCLDFMKETDLRPDLTVTSPPYDLDINYGEGINDNLNLKDYEEFNQSWLSGLFKITQETGRLCLNIPLDTNRPEHCPVYANFVKLAQKIGWNYRTTIVWHENNLSSRLAWGSFKSPSAPNIMSPVEMIVVFHKGSWKKQTKGTSDISSAEFVEWSLGYWKFSGEKKKNVGGHPAAYPKELPKRCIKLFSFREDIIFDPFAGSGTTLVVAKELEREYIGTEINKEFCEFAKHRLENYHDKNS